MDELLETVCMSYGEDIFTSKDVYDEYIKLINKRGSLRHFKLTYSQIRQKLARVYYIEKIDELEKTKRVSEYKYKKVITDENTTRNQRRIY
jgi:hypothetical protein